MSQKSCPISDSDTEGLDVDVLRKLLKQDEEQVVSMLLFFPPYARELFSGLKQCATQGDVKAVAHAAHSLRGSAGCLGARRLCDLLHKLETGAKGLANGAAAADACAAQVARIEEELEWVYARIDRLTANATPNGDRNH